MDPTLQAYIPQLQETSVALLESKCPCQILSATNSGITVYVWESIEVSGLRKQIEKTCS